MRGMFVGAYLISTGCMFVQPALAQQADCGDQATQREMTVCAQKAFEEADGELNQIWPLAMDQAIALDELEPDGAKPAQEALRAAQRAWIVIRDNDCLLVGFQARGGSLEPALAASCKAERTSQRTQWLRNWIQDVGMQ